MDNKKIDDKFEKKNKYWYNFIINVKIIVIFSKELVGKDEFVMMGVWVGWFICLLVYW